MRKSAARATEEMYVKTVRELSSGKKSAKTKDISRALGISPASVTEMLVKLSRKGFVQHSPYHGVYLTPRGKKAADSVLRRYRLLRRFFSETLGLPDAEATRQACLIEHCITSGTERRITWLMNHHKTCVGKRAGK